MARIGYMQTIGKTDNWATPQTLFDALDREFRFTLDVCADPDNAKCDRFFTKEDDCLIQDWGEAVCWMNPPYGHAIKQFLQKAHEATKRGATVVCLVPAKTDTKWWHDVAMKHEIRLIRGRLKFGNAKHPAPFGSAIIVMRPQSFSLTVQPTE